MATVFLSYLTSTASRPRCPQGCPHAVLSGLAVRDRDGSLGYVDSSAAAQASASGRGRPRTAVLTVWGHSHASGAKAPPPATTFTAWPRWRAATKLASGRTAEVQRCGSRTCRHRAGGGDPGPAQPAAGPHRPGARRRAGMNGLPAHRDTHSQAA